MAEANALCQYGFVIGYGVGSLVAGIMGFLAGAHLSKQTEVRHEN